MQEKRELTVNVYSAKKTLTPFFPATFPVGFGSSMFQTSGASCGVSNWTEAARLGTVPEATPARSHWDNYEADLDLIQSTGAKQYRVSIEWSHIEPEQGRFDDDVIRQYHKIIDACIARGITPMLTLYHFNEPLWFTQLKGFERERNIIYFIDYCSHVFALFSPKVKLWCTINEPAVQAFMGYFLGDFPPHKHDIQLTVTVLKNLLKAHVDVYFALKGLPEGDTAMIGIVHNVLRFKQLHKLDPIGCLITGTFTPITDDLVMSFFRTGIFKYKRVFFPNVAYHDERAPNANDFFGLNFYANPIVGFNRQNVYGPTCRTGQVMGDMFLPVDPVGFADALDRVATLGKPIHVTEIGVADASDKLRQSFLKEYFGVIKTKIESGMDIRSCMLWTTWDNYEWNQGHTKNFGFFDAHRQPRESVKMLKEMLGVAPDDTKRHAQVSLV